MQSSHSISGRACDLCTTPRFETEAGPSPTTLLAAQAGWSCTAFQLSYCSRTTLLLQAALAARQLSVCLVKARQFRAQSYTWTHQRTHLP